MIFTTAVSDEEEKTLPLRIVSVGTDHIQEPIQRPNGIRYYQVFICTYGVGETVIDNKRYVMREGQGMFLVPNTTHIYYALEPGWKVDYVLFTGPACAAILNSLGLSESMIFSYSRPEVFRDHIQKLISISESRSSRKNLSFSEECYSLLLDTSYQINRIEASQLEEADDTILRIIGYLEQHYREDISLDDIAAYIGRSKEHVCRICKNNMQETFTQMLTRVRLFQARQMLLQQPEMSIQEISAACGFRTISYFDRVFRKWEGISPSDYRLHKKSST
ncbi:MAG: helix-turn-helix domain-containing protein [Lachnospiraceae bacterium]|nr:helix-turn-helix domain-containing protein [Lachnospiraceae bacterium]